MMSNEMTFALILIDALLFYAGIITWGLGLISAGI